MSSAPKAFNTPINWRAADSQGISAVHKLLNFSAGDACIRCGIIATEDLGFFGQCPFQFIGRGLPQGTDPSAVASRVAMYRLLIQNLACRTSFTRNDVVYHILANEVSVEHSRKLLAEFIATDAERFDILRVLLEQSPPGLDLAEELPLIEAPAHLVKESDGSTILHFLRSPSAVWDRFLGADDIRTPNKFGETPIHHWVDKPTSKQFWEFCLRHKARIDDFELRDSSGESVLAQCLTHVAKHLPAIRARLKDKKTTAEEKQFLNHCSAAIHHLKKK